MTDMELADEIIKRLNKLIEDPAVKEDLGLLMELRFACSTATAEHETIQVQQYEGLNVVGFLGFLNGLVGVIPLGDKKGWGHISACFNDDGKLTHFARTQVS